MQLGQSADPHAALPAPAVVQHSPAATVWPGPQGHLQRPAWRQQGAQAHAGAAARGGAWELEKGASELEFERALLDSVSPQAVLIPRHTKICIGTRRASSGGCKQAFDERGTMQGLLAHRQKTPIFNH